MPYKPSTFDLSLHGSVISAWQTVLAGMTEAPGEEYFLAGRFTKSKALSKVLLFNRVRAAMRAQWPDGHRFNHIGVGARKEDNGDYLVVFTDRSEEEVVIVDKEGKPLD